MMQDLKSQSRDFGCYAALLAAVAGCFASTGCSSLPFQKKLASDEVAEALPESPSWQERLARLKKRGQKREASEEAVVEFKPEQDGKKSGGAASKTLTLGRWTRPETDQESSDKDNGLASSEAASQRPAAEEAAQVVHGETKPAAGVATVEAAEPEEDEPAQPSPSDLLVEECRRLAQLYQTAPLREEPEQAASYDAPTRPLKVAPVVSASISSDPPPAAPDVSARAATTETPVEQRLPPAVTRTSSGSTVPENSLRPHTQPAVVQPMRAVEPQPVRSTPATESVPWDHATLRPVDE